MTHKCTFLPLTLHLLYRLKFLNVSRLYHPGWPSADLNMSKTELLILPPKPGPTTSFHITVGSTIIHRACCLGVKSSSHIQKVAKNCRFFLRNITEIRHFLCCSTAKTLDTDPHSLPSRLL
ncbi:hypothetical protein FKM82_015394 [Ascaphus truei]